MLLGSSGAPEDPKQPSSPSDSNKQSSEYISPESIEEVVKVAYTKGCSDVHLGVEEEPRFRNRGDISVENVDLMKG